MSSGVPSTGGGAPDSGTENLTESGLSGVVKSFASGAGRLLASTLSGGKSEEIRNQKQGQAQAEMLSTLKDRASRGETFEPDDYRNWQNAGGDPGVIAGLQKDAIGFHKERQTSVDLLEHMHKGGLMTDAQYSMWAMAMYSGDPTAMTLAQESIKSQANLAGIQLRGQMQQQVQSQRDAAAKERTDETTRSREKVSGENIQSREKVAGEHEEGADRRTQEKIQSQEKIAKERKVAGNKALQTAGLKNIAGAADAVKAVEAGKAKDGSDLDDNTKAGIIDAANQKLVSTPGVSLEKMATNGAFMLDVGGSEKGLIYGTNPTKQRTYATGLSELIQKSSKVEGSEVTPEMAATFRTEWTKALKEKDTRARLGAMDAAIQKLPEGVRSQLHEQLNGMLSSVQQNAATEDVENPDSDDSDDGDGDE